MQKLSIIGGGIGGLATAACLRHYDVPFELYETASALGEVGAGIGISESTVEILAMLGLKERLLQSGMFIKYAILVDKRGGLIRKLPVVNGGYCIHRKDLIDILSLDLPQEKVHLDHRLTSLEQKKGFTEIVFAKQGAVNTEYLIAADGINSVVRQALFPKIRKRYSGQTIWRGISRIELPEKYHNTYLEFWGGNVRFGIIPLNKQQYYWYAAGCSVEGQKDHAERLKPELQRLFKNHASELQEVIGCAESIIRNDMYDLKPHDFPWHKQNVVFIGDAIHATTPNLAQGGCQAIEDAMYLATLIHKQGLSEDTFMRYHLDRKEKVNYIVNQSWRFGKIAHRSNRFSDYAVQLLFKWLPGNYFKNQYATLVDIDYIKNVR